MKLSIIVASHGDEHWRRLAQQRALPSAHQQDAHQVLDEHHPTDNRATVRNRLAARATGDWLCFLDADDELDRNYAHQMSLAVRPFTTNQGRRLAPLKLLTPAVSYVRAGKRQPPRFWPEIPLSQGNWMVVGTLVPKRLFTRVGGWRHLDGTGIVNEYDDWDMWIRCTLEGAEPVKVPKAVYVAHMEATSQHRSVDRRTRIGWHHEIGSEFWPDIYDDGWLASAR